jgi:hypothetical protein
VGDDVGVLTLCGNSVTSRGFALVDGAVCGGATAGGALPPHASVKKSALHAQKVRALREGASKIPERAQGPCPATPPKSMRFRSFAWVLSALPLTLACSSDKSAVALSASIDDPMLVVQSSSVGADATGGFSLAIELGEYASGDTQVSLGTFSIQRDAMDLIAPLSLAGASFPVSLGVGKKVMLPLTFDASTDPDVATNVCGAPVLVRGTLTDTLSNNHPTSVTSGTFDAQCQ